MQEVCYVKLRTPVIRICRCKEGSGNLYGGNGGVLQGLPDHFPSLLCALAALGTHSQFPAGAAQVVDTLAGGDLELAVCNTLAKTDVHMEVTLMNAVENDNGYH